MATALVKLLVLVLCLVAGKVAGQGCHEGWHLHKGYCYGFGESPVAWGDAQELCRAFNARLAEIETEDENNYLINLLTSRRVKMAWLGGTDILDEGTWEWTSTGQEIYPYTDWAPYQPDDYGNSEDCLTLFQVQDVGYRWNDFPCDHSANFLCEAEPSDVIVG